MLSLNASLYQPKCIPVLSSQICNKPSKTDKRSHTTHIHVVQMLLKTILLKFKEFNEILQINVLRYSNEDLTGCSMFSQAWIKEGITCSPNKAASNVSVTSKSTLEIYQQEKIYINVFLFESQLPADIFIHL